MTLLTRNEADIIAATIEHAYALGIDQIIATDNGSVDGTADILADYARSSPLELHHQPKHTYEQSRWVTFMARLAARQHAADWVVNSDADEFLWPAAAWKSRTLAEIFEAVPSRFGLVGLNEVLLRPDITRGGAWVDRLVIAQQGSVLSGWSFDFWKVSHRADPFVNVLGGNHIAFGPRIGLPAPQQPLCIFHVPDRSYERYERKVRDGNAAFAANGRLRRSFGTRLRADYELLKSGQLAAAYEERQAKYRDLLGTGQAHIDLSLRDHLHGLVAKAIRPDHLRHALGS